MIGDLLAQITGEPVQQTSTPPASKPIGPLKRKANDDTRNNSAKAPRLEASTRGAGGSTTNPRPTDRPASTPYRGTAMSRPTGASRPTGGQTVRPAAPASTPAKTSSGTNGMNGTNATNGARPTSASVRKGPTAPATTAPSSAAAPSAKPAPPKKGSYAEILARAKLAQTTMGQVGKIQHKGTEKKKERPEAKKDAKQPVPTTISRYQGTARPANGTSRAPTTPALQRRATSTGAMSKDTRNLDTDRPRMKRSASVTEEEPKKVKKAALATTGYTGTARPRPGATTSANSRKPAAPGGALLNPRAGARYGGSARRSRYEEEDEELDDFIEYDDEEEEPVGGPRYRYDSGSESDMEAGMDDIYEEEARAARAARLEDLEQEKLERRLKAEKEERRRRFLEEQKKKNRG
ncbi:SPT2-domain-containing protein [Sodiomyces alkalinus F11]|uniref:SPT2-domain-containing protein n=1 Tax=Sodiomyces alkalinus (strain CBS 110278 / VKM F-3762 / F11) TaxID=1314773 RepID=A0A3N2PM41_SODAK|nr:SPT2-domain-containing protein [Sodiomyces alkalinus F11]ROT35597.1 SPT2-domain-containing protein [Sodiomyces alkalinus F11]